MASCLTNGASSMQDVYKIFNEKGIIKPGESNEASNEARALIFAVFGWQTMLYKPDFGSCRPDGFSIVDELHGYQCLPTLELKQNASSWNRPFYEFLLGFGAFMPPQNYHPNLTEFKEEDAAFHNFRTVDPSSCNAYVLRTVGDLEIQWVDTLSCHLQLDRKSKILYLYKYPSFCIANLNSSLSDQEIKGALHACAAPEIDGPRAWASAEEVTQLLGETVTTYRLLFGQTKPARRYYRQLDPFHGLPKEGHDPLLKEICARKQGILVGQYPEREVYDLARDFPIYRARLAAVQHHLSTRTPRTWSELWKDKRDSAQWFTFWAVIIIGGLGIIFAFMQVVLQIVQIGLSS